jgi:hypothetical protein
MVGMPRVLAFLTVPAAGPHLYESDVANAVAVAEAGLVVENGAGYDDFLSQLLSASRAGRDRRGHRPAPPRARHHRGVRHPRDHSHRGRGRPGPLRGGGPLGGRVPRHTVLTTQSLSALYGTHIDVIRVHGHIVIVGGDGACTHPDDDGSAGQVCDRHDGHAGHSPEGHQH